VHEEHVLHRDIDPNNVYLADDGTVVLLDFGAARTAVGEQTQSMSVVLKRGYAPHEQYHSHGDQGPWTDVYATSATLYRALTGYKPPEAAARILKDELAAPNELVPSLSDATNDAILEGLSVRPDDRPQSVEAFADLLPTPPDDTEPGWVDEATSMDAPSADTEAAAELQVTASHACRLYVDGTLSTELPPGETYTLAVEGGSHRLRAVRTDRAGSGDATVTASEADPEVEEGSQLSIEALMWQSVVTAAEEAPTTVEIDFEEEGAADAPGQVGDTVQPGETAVPGETEVSEETEIPDDTEAPDEGTGDERPEETTEAVEETDDAEEPVPEADEPVAEPPSGAVPPTEEAPTEKAGPPPEPAGDEKEEVATLRLETDRAARLLVDGDRRARIDADGTQTVALSPGRHRVRAEAANGAAIWEHDVAAEAGTEQALQISLDRTADTDQGAMVSKAALQYAGAGTGVLVVLLLVGWWALSNEPPLASPDRALTIAEPVVVDVVANDRDPDNDALRIRSAGPVPDSVATVETVDSTRLRIRPASGFVGTAQVPYVLADAPGDTSRAHVTLRVPFDGTQQVVTRQAKRPQDVHPVPLGGDVPDVALAALGNEAVGWVPHASSAPGNFDSLAVLATSRDGAVDVHAADLTGNGRSDLLSSSLRGDVVQWYENRSDSAFAAPQAVTTEIDGPVAVQTADLDGDGDPDVIVGTVLGRRLLWYENQGDGTFGDGQEIASGVRGLETLHVTNLDNDDAPDVLAVSYRDSTLYRYEPTRPSPGSVRFEAGPSIEMDVGGPIEVHTADLTGDGWTDVIVGMAGDSSVVVVENRTDTTGTLRFADGRVLATDVKTVEGLDTGDVEGDGHPDIFAGAFKSDAVVWFENDGDGSFASAQTIAADVPNVLSLAVADVNGDGTPDVVAASQADDVVVWYENHLR
jgi:hypothetical protein